MVARLALALSLTVLLACGSSAALPAYQAPPPVALEDTDLYRYVMDEEEDFGDEDYADEDYADEDYADEEYEDEEMSEEGGAEEADAADAPASDTD